MHGLNDSLSTDQKIAMKRATQAVAQKHRRGETPSALLDDLAAVLAALDSKQKDRVALVNSALRQAATTTSGDAQASPAPPGIAGRSPQFVRASWFLAADACNVVRLKALAAEGVDPNQTLPTPGGLTALMLAAKKGNLECVAFLASISAPNTMSSFGRTALWTAALISDVKMVELLLKTENARLADRFGETPLMRAARNGHPECVRLLLPRSDPNAQNKDGETALHILAHARKDSEESVKMAALLSPCADWSIIDKKKQTALSLFGREEAPMLATLDQALSANPFAAIAEELIEKASLADLPKTRAAREACLLREEARLLATPEAPSPVAKGRRL